jgi:salicylate hydroxylase
MGPNAVRVLHRLGLRPALDRDGVRPIGTWQRRWQDGRTLQQAPLNPLCEELYGAPHVTIHRRDLLAAIASAFPQQRVHLGHRLAGFTDTGDRVEAWFDNGARIETDVLVGADGIHSTVRAALFGDEAPMFAGCVAYRGLVPVERIADLGLELRSQSWVGRPFRALLRIRRARVEFRRLDRARHVESRGLDGSRNHRPSADGVRRLA